jgi:hypothetical protein
MTLSKQIGMRPGYYYSGLGITASHARAISNGKAFDHFFPATMGNDPIVNKNAEVHDTLRFVSKVVSETLADTKIIAGILKKSNLRATLQSIFDFHYDHYQYKLDKAGIEQVRRPARAWKDRKEGIDCDCFTTSVSSMLVNLGIPHYLKIIGINNRPYFQHIYVVVPKSKKANLDKRSDYYVLDPVLNRFDEEAPTITKKDYLAMENVNGIPLQYLNGLGSSPQVNGLGTEFDDLDQVQGLSGIDSLSGLERLFDGFKKRLHTHVARTRKKVKAQPSSVSAVYDPNVLEGMLGELENALAGPDSLLMGTLESLSNREHLCLNHFFRNKSAAIHGHDDYLYGEMFGELDETMLDTVTGLGKKGKAAAKQQAANAGKKGVFTKVKNAVKKVAEIKKKAVATVKKAAPLKKVAATAKKVAKKVAPVLKKVGKVIVKTNPLAITARAGFLVAMRTNFAKIAEKAYWAYKTRSEAKAAGISDDYYNKSLQLLEKIRKPFIKVLKGEESALKKSIINGRAAKKVSKAMKGLGYPGSTGELAGLNALGSAAAAGTSVATALAFLTPIIQWVNKSFKAKPGAKADADGNALENENGTIEEAASTDSSEAINNMITEGNSPSDTTVPNDASVETAVATNEEDPSGLERPKNSTDIREFQTWFNTYQGGRLKVDGKWGPKSQGAWDQAGLHWTEEKKKSQNDDQYSSAETGAEEDATTWSE